jgi:hypothetical protein
VLFRANVFGPGDVRGNDQAIFVLKDHAMKGTWGTEPRFDAFYKHETEASGVSIFD